PAPGPAGRPRPRRGFVVATVAWVLVLVGGSVWAITYGRPTAREQTSIAQARPIVDNAVGRLAAAAADSGSVVAISGFDLVGSCRITVFRSGVRYQRTVTVLTAAGAEPAVLDRVASALPGAFRVHLRSGSRPRLTADAGDFVAVTGGVNRAGEVRLVADTGCRTVDGAPVAADPTPAGTDPTDGARAPVSAVLSALGAQGAQWHTYRVPCPTGGPLATVEAVAARPPEGRLSQAVPTGATNVAAGPDAVAFRTEAAEVGVRTVIDRVVVTATTRCP
ncbi:MAG: hypothetical protein ACM30G_17370, partial [Micromonosporaceae bacterium]